MRIITVKEAIAADIPVSSALSPNPDLFVLVDDDESILFWSPVKDDVVRAERAYR